MAKMLKSQVRKNATRDTRTITCPNKKCKAEIIVFYTRKHHTRCPNCWQTLRIREIFDERASIKAREVSKK